MNLENRDNGLLSQQRHNKNEDCRKDLSNILLRYDWRQNCSDQVVVVVEERIRRLGWVPEPRARRRPCA